MASANGRSKGALVIDERVLDLLCCPTDRGVLQCTEAGPSGSSLRCTECGHTYPIRNGIPRFVAGDQYAGNFTYEWTIHKTTQLDDGRSTISERTFAERTGWTPADVNGRVVLDVGCGMGRFADVVLRWGGHVVGVDLSYAVDSARANLAHHKHFTGVQASVFALPFREASFDLIYSIGVLHHTPDAARAFQCLPPLLRPGGQIAVWVYSSHVFPSAGVDERRDRLIRAVTTRMPPRALYLLCRALCRIRVPFGPLWHMILPGLLFHAFPRTHKYDRYDWRVLDTFDWYSPVYQSKHSYPEVFRWFRDAGLTDITLLPVEVAVQGTKALHPSGTCETRLTCAE